jgi:hypothetical protein
MSAMERVVRPFQTRQVSYPQQIIDTTQAPAEDVILTIGQEGSTKIYNESFSSSVTSYNETKSKETKRETETKRIENDSDPSQFVDVEIIKKLSVEQGKGRDYKKINYEFNNK